MVDARLLPRGLTQASARAAGWNPPAMTDPLYLQAMRDNPGNPWLASPKVRQANAQQARLWNDYIGQQTGQMTFAPAPVHARDDFSEWGRRIEDGIAAKMSRIPISQGGWAEPQGTGLGGGGLFGALLSTALGMATGNPWLSAAFNAGRGGLTGGLRGAVTGGATSFLPGPRDVLSRLTRVG